MFVEGSETGTCKIYWHADHCNQYRSKYDDRLSLDASVWDEGSNERRS